jgi:CheY-like chemotaxis protein
MQNDVESHREAQTWLLPGFRDGEAGPSASSMASSFGKKAAIPRRVLVVEDNPDTVRSTVVLLRDMGHHVDYAMHGYSAIDVALRFRPDFVFLDLGLPGINGFEVCSRMKKQPGLEHVRIIAITGYGQDEYRVRAKAAGCEMVLLKPVSPRVLEELLLS